MGYKEFWGFNKICTNIKNYVDDISLSSNLEESVYVLAYLINNNNPLGNMLRSTRLDKYIITPLDPHIRKDKLEKVTDTACNTFLNKGHRKNGEIECNANFNKFLSALTEYLIDNGKINYRNFNIIKCNLKNLLDANLYVNKHPSEEDYKNVEGRIFADFFKLVFEDVNNSLEQAAEVDNILQYMQYSDRYAALTWIMLFSLYPQANNNDLLKLSLIGPFRSAYEEKDFVTPPIIQCDASSYDALCESLSKKYNHEKPYIEKELTDYFVTKKKKLVAGSNESYEYIHLVFLGAARYFKENKFNQKELEEYLPKLNRFINDVKELDLDDENYWIDYIQLLLLQVDFFWKTSRYSDMKNILYSIENIMYNRYEITDRYRNLLAKLKRKQGIYFNRVMDFENVIRTYSSSFFIYDSNMKYERSMIKNNEAFMYRKWMKLDLACQAYDVAKKLREYREEYDPNSMIILKSNMSRTYFYSHDFAKATELIDFAYRERKKLYENNPKVFKGVYSESTKAYAENLLFQGIFDVDSKNKNKYLTQSDEKLTEIYSLMETFSNTDSIREYNEIYGRLRYYQRDWPDSISYFNKVIECVKSTETAKHRHVTALIYLGKIMYSENNINAAFSYLKDAYNLSQELHNRSYYLYTKMVATFNLGAFLYLENWKDNLPLSEETSSPVIASDLIGHALTDIEELMRDSDSDLLDKKYKGINARAFSVEHDQIQAFSDSIKEHRDMPNNENREELRNMFLNFYVGRQ